MRVQLTAIITSIIMGVFLPFAHAQQFTPPSSRPSLLEQPGSLPAGNYNLSATLERDEDAHEFTGTVKLGGVLEVRGLKLVKSNPPVGAVLRSADDKGTAEWSVLTSELPPGSPNETLRYNEQSLLVATSFLTNTGNRIGIGTTDPQELVHLATDSASVSQFRIADSDQNENPELQLQYGPQNQEGGNKHWAWYVHKPSNSLRLWGAGSQGTDRMALTPGGSVIIGGAQNASQTNEQGPSLEIYGATDVQDGDTSFFTIDPSRYGVAVNAPVSDQYALNVGGQVAASDRFCLEGSCKNWEEISPWKTHEGTANIYYDKGMVGVGTSSPAVLLDIVKDSPTLSDTSILRLRQVAERVWTGVRIDRSSEREKWFVGMDNQSEKFIIRRDGLSNDVAVDTTGNVGIGTDAPGAKLAVHGSPAKQGLGTVYQSDVQSVVITGKGTKFMEQLKPASTIQINTYGKIEQRIVVSVQSDTSLLVDVPFSYLPLAPSRAQAFTYSSPLVSLNNRSGPQLFINAEGDMGIGTAFPNASIDISVPARTRNFGIGIDSTTFGTDANAASQSYYFRARSTGNTQKTALYLRGDSVLGIGTESPQALAHVGDVENNAPQAEGSVARIAINSAKATAFPWYIDARNELGEEYLDFKFGGKSIFSLQSQGSAVIGEERNPLATTIRGDIIANGNLAARNVDLRGEITAADYQIRLLGGGTANVAITGIPRSAGDSCNVFCKKYKDRKCVLAMQGDNITYCNMTGEGRACTCANIEDVAIKPKISEFCSLDMPQATGTDSSCKSSVTVQYPYPINLKWQTRYADDDLWINGPQGVSYRSGLVRQTAGLNQGGLAKPDYYSFTPEASYYTNPSTHAGRYTLYASNYKNEQTTRSVDVTINTLYPEFGTYSADRSYLYAEEKFLTISMKNSQHVDFSNAGDVAEQQGYCAGSAWCERIFWIKWGSRRADVEGPNGFTYHLTVDGPSAVGADSRTHGTRAYLDYFLRKDWEQPGEFKCVDSSWQDTCDGKNDEEYSCSNNQYAYKHGCIDRAPGFWCQSGIHRRHVYCRPEAAEVKFVRQEVY